MITLMFLISQSIQPLLAAAVLPTTNNTTLTDSSILKSALSEFKNLSRKEKKERFRVVKKEMKAYKASKRNGENPSTNTLLMVILAIILPPLAVYLHEGKINNKFWIDVLLTLLFFLPGVIYALVVVLDKD